MPAGWREVLQALGLRPGEVLGRGMEGVVVAQDPDTVAKVWTGRTADGIAALREFGDALAQAGLPFRTPRIRAVHTALDTTVTVEDRLSGAPLGTAGGPHELTAAAAGAMTAVLSALRGVTPAPAMAVLPVLPGEAAFDPGRPFAVSLAELVRQRAERSAAVLRRRLPDLDQVVAATLRELGALGTTPVALLHGDLVPANVLVDERGRVSAVLDFGFLSTVGDPVFDAAVTASVFDMYGPRARDIEARLDAAFAGLVDAGRDRVPLYRAAYALATCTVFSSAGDDGHFDWCVKMLQRPDVRGRLGR